MARRPPIPIPALALALFGTGPAAAHPVNTYVLGPDDDWCAFIDEAWAGGDLILLEPGDYVGPCTIEGKPPQEPEETTTIQSLDTTNPARFLHDGAADHVLRITGEHVALYALVFEGVPEGVDAVRVEGSGTRYWARLNTFRDVAGTAFRAVSGHGVRLRDTRFERVTGAPVVFGCEGGGCPVEDLMLAGNLFDGASGAVIHPDAWGLVSDNIGADLAAPGLVYAGSGGPGVVEGNLLVGDEVLVVSSSGALVRNNVLVGHVRAVGAVDLLGNSLLGEVEPGAGRFEGNAVLGPLPAEGAGNVACAAAEDCWIDAAAWDFRPVEDGPLVRAGVVRPELALDFCGSERPSPPDAGALQFTRGGHPLVLELKSHQTCAGVVDEVPDPSGEEVDEGCGCATPGPRAGFGPLLLLLAVVRRRRDQACAAGRRAISMEATSIRPCSAKTA